MDLTFVPLKGLTKRLTHLKYENCITYHSKVMTNVKGFVFFADKRTLTDGETGKLTGQKVYAPNLSMWFQPAD